MKPFEIIDHTADIGLIAYGHNKEEVFENAARGMFEIMAGGEKSFKEDFYDKIKVEADQLEDLFFAWLSKLLYLAETKLVILNQFQINKLTDFQLKAEVRGAKINPPYVKIEKEIKAVTYYALEIKKDEESGLWRARVIFDL